MRRYSPERKEAQLKKLLPSHNMSVAELARQEGISDVTLYAWRTDKKHIRELERELRRKDKGLAISLRTLQRWTHKSTLTPDGRTTTSRPTPANALTDAEREAILQLCNSAEYAHLPPSQIVPRLADQGRYLASESSFYRVLHAADQLHRWGRSQRPKRHPAPTTHAANGPNQLWSWNITYLPSPVRGQYYYLYLIEDLYSRKGMGWEVHEQECGDKAAALLQRSVLSEQCLHQPLVLHSDNRAPMKSVTLT